MDKSALAKRMKENYESRSKQFLTRRVPVIVRLDGKLFHSYTKGLNRPYDEGLMQDMQNTAKYLCSEIQGCKAAYTQSDEISLLITDFEHFTTDAYFDYNVQKITSATASYATAKFNQLRTRRAILDKLPEMYKELNEDFKIYDAKKAINKDFDNKSRTIQKSLEIFNSAKLAQFDSRIFQIPENEEVVNYFIWRQRDAIKNSIQMLGQSIFSDKQLHKKNTSEIIDMCYEKGERWHELSSAKQRGSFITKQTFYKDEENTIKRTKWECYEETPLFPENRESILSLLIKKQQ